MNAETQKKVVGKWWVCGLLLLALMLNYMDRQTLSLTIPTIKPEMGWDEGHYGNLEAGFAYAFALGGLLMGVLADRWSVRWMYPIVLLGWSLAGVATGFADRIGEFFGTVLNVTDKPEQTFVGFLICRVVLGFFEAGQWPCALITTQRLLQREHRALGNSVLQSGASIGAIITPLVVNLLDSKEVGAWRLPYVVIGVAGLLWLFPWFWMVAGVDFSPATSEGTRDSQQPAADEAGKTGSWDQLIRRFAVLVIVVVSINLPWHFFRAWLPLFLQEFHQYEKETVRYFLMAYYVSTDVGCLCIGVLTRWLVQRKFSVHRSRVVSFAVCAAATMLSLVAARAGRGPVLMGALMLIGAGSLGLFPLYYSLSQELSARRQGLVTGALSAITWCVTAAMQAQVGEHIKATKSYETGIAVVGMLPLLGLFALMFLWGRDETPQDGS